MESVTFRNIGEILQPDSAEKTRMHTSRVPRDVQFVHYADYFQFVTRIFEIP